MSEEKNILDNLGNVRELLAKHKLLESLVPRPVSYTHLDVYKRQT